MPFKSKAQQRFLESKASPLSEGQKKEWEEATDFSKLPAHKKVAKKLAGQAMKAKKK